MQRDREAGENSNINSPFGNLFGGFGFGGSMLPSIFGGKDPFDDPFFSRPDDSFFGSNMFSQASPHSLQHNTSGSKGPVIEELESDNEEMLENEEEDDASRAAWGNKNPIVEHPEDQSNGNRKSASNGREILLSNTNRNKVEVAEPQTKSVSYQRVTYGGINGAYYTATTSRRRGNDGVTIEESKQADRTTGQATHKVSRGIHEKGHSVTRKLDSDGKVDTVQTLHNLDEDELEGFEQAWRGNTDKHLHGWNDTFDFPGSAGAWGGFMDPFREHSHGRQNLDRTGGRPKKVVTINIE